MQAERGCEIFYGEELDAYGKRAENNSGPTPSPHTRENETEPESETLRSSLATQA
ncbi:hypothetical protein GCM10011410_11080 [Hoyosella rhizosphaerae]|uniref:Uncharacterized protein n=1 Tax=Hoyosella rhizosphaerae TaxID=1755582 RepID=A0A916XAU6_9ACTN|nr:hypothetical protein GCM10011410_11080 [Hoyosella rhizosphaerae]